MKLESGMNFKVDINKFSNPFLKLFSSYSVDGFLYITLIENDELTRGFRIYGANFGKAIWSPNGMFNWEWVYKNSEPLSSLEKTMYGV